MVSHMLPSNPYITRHARCTRERDIDSQVFCHPILHPIFTVLYLCVNLSGSFISVCKFIWTLKLTGAVRKKDGLPRKKFKPLRRVNKSFNSCLSGFHNNR